MAWGVASALSHSTTFDAGGGPDAVGGEGPGEVHERAAQHLRACQPRVGQDGEGSVRLGHSTVVARIGLGGQHDRFATTNGGNRRRSRPRHRHGWYE